MSIIFFYRWMRKLQHQCSRLNAPAWWISIPSLEKQCHILLKLSRVHRAPGFRQTCPSSGLNRAPVWRQSGPGSAPTSERTDNKRLRIRRVYNIRLDRFRSECTRYNLTMRAFQWVCWCISMFLLSICNGREALVLRSAFVKVIVDRFSVFLETNRMNHVGF